MTLAACERALSSLEGLLSKLRLDTSLQISPQQPSPPFLVLCFDHQIPMVIQPVDLEGDSRFSLRSSIRVAKVLDSTARTDRLSVVNSISTSELGDNL